LVRFWRSFNAIAEGHNGVKPKNTTNKGVFICGIFPLVAFVAFNSTPGTRRPLLFI
jgi:hypothetical protein